MFDKDKGVIFQGSLEGKKILSFGSLQIKAVVSKSSSFTSVKEAKEHFGCNTSVILVDPSSVVDALLEAKSCGMEKIICMNDSIPIKDMIYIRTVFNENNLCRLIGPGSLGVIAPGRYGIGLIRSSIYRRGGVGIVSRSFAMKEEAALQLSRSGIGISLSIDIGNDSLAGTHFIDLLKFFEEDPFTQAILMIGEMGGELEEEAAEWVKGHAKKSVVAYVAGHLFAREKVKALLEAKVVVIQHPSGMAKALERVKK